MKCRSIKVSSTKLIAKLIAAIVIAFPFALNAATPNHIQIALSSTNEAVGWYEEYLDCERVVGSNDAVVCGETNIEFFVGRTVGGSQGSAIDHIGFSVPDLDSKMA